MAAMIQAVGECQCHCIVTFFVSNCFNEGEPSITVSVRTLAGVLITSGVTDAMGKVALNVPASTVRVATSGSSTRWTEFSGEITVACDTTFQLLRAAAPGYFCQAGLCSYPVKQTLQYTDVNGTFPLVWDTGFYFRGCGLAPSMADVVTTVHAGTCAADLGTDSMPYAVELSLPFGASNLLISFCTYLQPPFGPYYLYHGDGTSVGSCAGGTFSCPVISGCEMWIHSGASNGAGLVACDPLLIAGTNPPTAPYANPAEGAWIITE